MPRRHSLSLHWPLHRRRASQSQPSSPVTPRTNDPQDASPRSATDPASSRAETNLRLSKAEMRAMAKEAWKELDQVLESHWEWPPSPDHAESPLLGFNIARDQLYREREQSFTPPPPDDTAASIATHYASLERGGNGLDAHEPAASEDETGTYVTDTEKKRKQHEDTLSEMAWNDGLRTFIERRDAWTGAVRAALPAGTEPTHDNVLAALEPPRQPSRS
ncbi:MAG: hypothetical protein LQ340_004175, partial [Diploschistes diacapsis]